MDPIIFFVFLEGDYDIFQSFFEEVGVDIYTWSLYNDAGLTHCADILSGLLNQSLI
tara:strand:- start:1286 stop:1453 length:168 start_codon:yes stop_codon:yes gene_type:complete